MRIVQFVNNLDMGGLERLVLDLAQCQLAEGHEPSIYCLTHPGRLAAEAEGLGIKVRSFQKPTGPSPRTVLRIARQLRIDRPDVLHLHNHLVHHYGVLAGLFTGVPVFVNTRHRSEQKLESSPNGSSISTAPTDRRSDLIFRATLPFVGAVVLISESTRKFFIQHCGVPESKARVILNGAHLERFLEAPAHPGGAFPRIRFGIAARLVAAKDHYTLLRAFTMVLRELPNAELAIAGDGPLRKELEAFTRDLNLIDRVSFVGALPDTPAFLSELDIFVLSSLSEGLPIALLEAMAAGLPIVSTRAGGVNEVAVEGQNAILSEPGDAEGLAQAMIQMAKRPDLAAMGAMGREKVKQGFRIEQTWAEYYKLFLSLGAKP
jgi:glycosyltransferase involved in cell wall biosynthesis